MWFLFASLAALFFGAQGAWIKKLSSLTERKILTWAIFFFGLPFLAFLLFLRGLPPVEKSFWPAAAGSLAVNMVAFSFFVKAISLSGLSLTFPFLAFTPVFLILTGLIILGEMPGFFGLAGIFMVSAGAYLLNGPEIKKGILKPLKAIKKEEGSLLMLGVAALWSIAAALDKIAVNSSGPVFFPLCHNIGFALFYPIIFKLKIDFSGEIIPRLPNFLLLGLLGSAMIFFQMLAIREAYASYVIAVKRGGMIFTFLMGTLFFREKFSFYRAAGTLLMAAGVIFIGVLGN